MSSSGPHAPSRAASREPREPRCNGALLLDQHQVMESLVGADVVRRAIAALPADQRAEYEGITSVSWIRVSTADAALSAVAREAGRDPLRFQAEVARVGVEKTLGTVWRVLLRLVTDEALVKRTPLLHSKTYDTGRMTARIAQPGRAEIALDDWPEVPEIDIIAIAAGVEAVLRAAGRREVRVRHERTRSGAFYVATWLP